MPYEFSPDERIQNIMWVLDQLQSRWADADTSCRSAWGSAIDRAFHALDEAIADMKPQPVTYELKYPEPTPTPTEED